MASGSTGSFVPKWHLAVLIGTPVALGLCYLYYRKQNKYLEDDDEPNISTKKKLILKGQTISLDGDDKSIVDKNSNADSTATQKSNKKLSPLEIATQHKSDGNVLFKKGKYDEAIICYDKAIESCPKDNVTDLSTFYQNRAAAYEQLKKWSSVKDDCTKALELNSRYIKALNRRARAFENTSKLFECLEDITATCLLEGFSNNSTLLYADRILKQTGRADAIKAMKNIRQIYPSKNFVKTYFASYTQDPIKKIIIASSEPKGFIRAKMALDADNYEVIIPACTEEIENSLAEYKNEALLLRGTFYLLSGLYQNALEDFTNIINTSDVSTPIKVNALIKRASWYIQHEETDKGFADFQMADKLDPKNADIYHQRGQVYILMDKLQEAAAEFAKAIELSPDQGITYIQKCYAEYRMAYLQQDQIGLFNVMNDFKHAIDKYPDCVDCYSVMGQVLSDQNQYEQASSFFDKAMEMAPTNASLYVHRGIMQLQWNGNIEKAIEYMTRAIEIDDKSELAYETLGTIEVQRGHLEEAVRLFEKAIALAKTEPEMIHLFALRNAAIAQINVAKNLGIDMQSISALAAINGN